MLSSWMARKDKTRVNVQGKAGCVLHVQRRALLYRCIGRKDLYKKRQGASTNDVNGRSVQRLRVCEPGSLESLDDARSIEWVRTKLCSGTGVPYVRTRLRLISFTITYYFPLTLSLANPVSIDFTPLPQNSYHARSTSTRLSPSINRDSIVLGRHRKKQGRRESKPYTVIVEIPECCTLWRGARVIQYITVKAKVIS